MSEPSEPTWRLAGTVAAQHLAHLAGTMTREGEASVLVLERDGGLEQVPLIGEDPAGAAARLVADRSPVRWVHVRPREDRGFGLAVGEAGATAEITVRWPLARPEGLSDAAWWAFQEGLGPDGSRTRVVARSHGAACEICLGLVEAGEERLDDGRRAWHLRCAADALPSTLAAALRGVPLPDDLGPELLVRLARAEPEPDCPPLPAPAAEVAPADGLVCVGCREGIEAGDLRVRLAGAWLLHPDCLRVLIEDEDLAVEEAVALLDSIVEAAGPLAERLFDALWSGPSLDPARLSVASENRHRALRAAELRRAGDLDGAEQLVVEMFEQESADPADVSPWIELAEIELARDDRDGALDAAWAAVRRDVTAPGVAELCARLGVDPSVSELVKGEGHLVVDVVDSGGAPLKAVVSVDGRPSVADPDGRVELFLEACDAQVEARCIGYFHSRVQVRVEAEAVRRVRIELAPVEITVEETDVIVPDTITVDSATGHVRDNGGLDALALWLTRHPEVERLEVRCGSPNLLLDGLRLAERVCDRVVGVPRDRLVPQGLVGPERASFRVLQGIVVYRRGDAAVRPRATLVRGLMYLIDHWRG
jgi:hypothetical protein